MSSSDDVISPRPASLRRPQFRPVLAVLAMAMAMAVAMSGCSAAADAGAAGAPDKGFISGNGTVAVIASRERKAPVSFRGATLEGDPFDVSVHRGSVVVVNVWGSWCPPCIAEAPALEKVWEQTRSKGVQFIGINTRDGRAQARAHQRKFRVTYPSVEDSDGRILLAFRGTLPPVAIPSTLVLDRAGRVAARILGRTSAGVLSGIISDLLAERPLVQ